ncbi:MAG: MarR family transcriptional regulator [Anaerolineae bacterium]|nr:MarR family transcriptional regulator [Anaerolineae bacterium]
MDTHEFQQLVAEIRVLMVRVVKTHARSAEEYFRDKNINPVQYGVLRTLNRESLTISELSKLLFLDPSTLVPIVDDLEAKELLERNKDPQDRRRTPLSLTEKGASLLPNFTETLRDDPLYESLNALDEDKLLQFAAILREVVLKLPEGQSILCNVHDHIYKSAK